MKRLYHTVGWEVSDCEVDTTTSTKVATSPRIFVNRASLALSVASNSTNSGADACPPPGTPGLTALARGNPSNPLRDHDVDDNDTDNDVEANILKRCQPPWRPWDDHDDTVTVAAVTAGE